MRRLSLLIITATILASCASVPSEPVEEADPTITVITPDETVPAPAAPPATREIKFYRPVEIRTLYPDGVVSSIQRFQYDDKGNLLREEVLGGNGILQSVRVYRYSASGVVDVSTLSTDQTLVSRTVQEWNGDRLIRESIYNPKDEPQGSQEYSYDGQGRRILWVVRTASGGETRTVYAWDGNRQVRSTVQTAAGAPIKSFIRTYGSDGLLVKEEERDGKDALVAVTDYAYTSGKLVAEVRKNASGAVQSRVEYRHDVEGNTVETLYYGRTERLSEKTSTVWVSFIRVEKI